MNNVKRVLLVSRDSHFGEYFVLSVLPISLNDDTLGPMPKCNEALRIITNCSY